MKAYDVFEKSITSVNSLHSAQLSTLAVYTFDCSRIKETTTSKRMRRIAFVYECRRSARRTNNKHSIASHLNKAQPQILKAYNAPELTIRSCQFTE